MWNAVMLDATADDCKEGVGLMQQAFKSDKDKSLMLEQARAKFNECVEVYEQYAPGTEKLSVSYSLYAAILLKQEQYEHAKEFANKSLQILSKKAPGSPVIADVYYILARAHERLQEWNDCIHFSKLFLAIPAPAQPQEHRPFVSKLLASCQAGLPTDEFYSLTDGPVGMLLRDPSNECEKVGEWPLEHHGQTRIKLKKCVDIFEQHAPGTTYLSFLYPIYALVMLAEGDFEQAKEFANKSLQILSKKAPGSPDIAVVYSILARAHERLQEWNDCIHFAEKSLAAPIHGQERQEVRLSVSQLLVNCQAGLPTDEFGSGKVGPVGMLLRDPSNECEKVGEWPLEHHGQTRIKFKKCVDIFEQHAPGTTYLSFLYSQYASVMLAEGDFEQAKEFANKSLQILSKKAPNSPLIASVYSILARAHARLQEWNDCIHFAEKSLAAPIHGQEARQAASRDVLVECQARRRESPPFSIVACTWLVLLSLVFITYFFKRKRKGFFKRKRKYTNGASSRVFLSHTGQDDSAKAFTAHLKEKLEDEGIPFFYDVSSIPFAVNWANYIETHAKNCTVFVAIISPTYFQRYWCMRELDLALRHDRPVLPVYYSVDGPKDLPQDKALFCEHLRNNEEGRVTEEELNQWWRNVHEKLPTKQGPRKTASTEKDADLYLKRRIVKSLRSFFPEQRKPV